MCLPGGGDRLVLAQRVGMACLGYTGERVLCGELGAGPADLRPPEIFNTDQGCQFTSEAFTGVLAAHGIAISMDGRGRALDNIFVERLWRSVTYEDVDLRGYATVPELRVELADYLRFYNTERLHQSLNDVTPDEVDRTASGGGARIADHFGETAATPPEAQHDTEPRGSAVPLHVTGYPLKLDALVS